MPGRSYPSLRFLLPSALVFLLVAGVVFSPAHARAEQVAATYTHGNLSVTIPYHSAHAGSGRLVAEILDPEDHILGRAERTVEASAMSSIVQPLAKAKAVEPQAVSQPLFAITTDKGERWTSADGQIWKHN